MVRVCVGIYVRGWLSNDKVVKGIHANYLRACTVHVCVCTLACVCVCVCERTCMNVYVYVCECMY